MGKIKLNLVSGSVVEKPLMNAFKANGMSYVIFDNELNGSMGLPIILVCKLEQNKLVKIIDQEEWQAVKEHLKSIIAGGQVEFIKLPNELNAEDIYYTQLTLPVPSFDALKNAYKVDEGGESLILENNNQVANEEEVTPSVETINQSEPAISVNPVNTQEVVNEPINPTIEPQVSATEPVVPSVSAMETPVMDMPVNTPQVDVSPVDIQPTQEIQATNDDTIGINDIPVSPVLNDIINPTIEPVAPVESVTPVVETEPVIPNPTINNAESVISTTEQVEIPSITDSASVFKEQKEAFMQACENMFDALVQKFEKELENKK